MTDGPSADAEFELRVDRFRIRAEAKIAGTTSFEEAAQSFADSLYSEFQDIIVLARVFAVIPFRRLEAPERSFVAASIGVTAASLLDDATPGSDALRHARYRAVLERTNPFARPSRESPSFPRRSSKTHR